MMDNGWIRLNRKILDWRWFTDSDTFRVFIYLLLVASYNERGFRDIDLKPGQAVVGRKKISQDLGISERRVRTSLNHLISTNEITIKSTNRFSVVTIVKWAFYQSGTEDIDQQNDQQLDHQSTNKRPTTDHIQKKNKEINKYIYANSVLDSVENEELKSALMEFMKMRKSIKRPMTEEAMRRLIRKCDRESNGNIEMQIEALHTAVDHCWQTVYFTDDIKHKYERTDIGGWNSR